MKAKINSLFKKIVQEKEMSERVKAFRMMKDAAILTATVTRNSCKVRMVNHQPQIQDEKILSYKAPTPSHHGASGWEEPPWW